MQARSSSGYGQGEEEQKVYNGGYDQDGMYNNQGGNGGGGYVPNSSNHYM